MSKLRIMLVACAALAASPLWAKEEIVTQKYNVKIVELAEGLSHPWSLAFLPDGQMLVTEREGRLRYVSAKGKLSKPIEGLPELYAKGQGGLLDVVLDPDFASNKRIYFSFAEAGNGGAGTAVASARLNGQALEDVQVIFRQQPKVSGDNHWGSRLVFGKDGTLFITLGERNQREMAQDVMSHLGKIVRINKDGSIPKDNPFSALGTARHEIWSYGHRNVQGAALNPDTGELWIHEHGAQGGDEINIARAGKNYGWPVLTKGIDYNGQPIAKATQKEGMEQPYYNWTPSIAPSGMVFYTGDVFPAWKGHLFVGALAGESLVRLELWDKGVRQEERLFTDRGQRIRDVRQGPDGLIYLLTDSDDGKILRVEPAK